MTMTAPTLALLLAAALISPATRPAETPHKLHDPALDKAVAVLDDTDDPLAAAGEAADLLGDGWQATARLREAAESGDARAVEAVAADLGFRPIDEAELPEGFPPPTPVGEIEVKQYPAYGMARVNDDEVNEGRMFWALFEHITSNDIPMTAPVEMTMADDGRDMKAMAFLYPAADTPTPAGTRPVVDKVVAEPQTVVSLGHRGGRSASLVAESGERLRAWAAENGYEAVGPMRVMGYNGPSVPRSRQYFEVQIPVAAATAASE